MRDKLPKVPLTRAQCLARLEDVKARLAAGPSEHALNAWGQLESGRSIRFASKDEQRRVRKILEENWYTRHAALVAAMELQLSWEE